ncbi:MAG: hypothetical protein OXU45_01180 [Candidatus Melainabacteria bacterium]|nr:hypothetical protein [Candidatus Melainabacteria bacterium]
MTLEGAKFDGLDPLKTTINPAIGERVSAAPEDSVLNSQLQATSREEIIASLGDVRSDSLLRQLETSFKERNNLILGEQDLFGSAEISDQIIQRDTDERLAPPRLDALSEIMADLESHEAVGIKPPDYDDKDKNQSKIDTIS